METLQIFTEHGGIEKRCLSKHRYATEAKAIKSHMRTARKKNNSGYVRAYHCEVCDGWHITTKRKNLFLKKPKWGLKR